MKMKDIMIFMFLFISDIAFLKDFGGTVPNVVKHHGIPELVREASYFIICAWFLLRYWFIELLHHDIMLQSVAHVWHILKMT